MSEKKIFWKNLIAQDHIKEMMQTAILSNSLGHAYLLCGDEGVGKFAAALDISLALLCQNSGNKPCHTCDSCKKVLTNNHPDFHVVIPVIVDKKYKASDSELSEKGWEFISSKVKEKIENPYVALSFQDDKESAGQSKIPSIPVDWIRETNHAIMRGAVSGDKIVVIFSNVDVMTTSSANALLKTLEEPPPNTYLILTTDRPQALLPTIASRCQVVRFGHVPFSYIKDALSQKLGAAFDERTSKRAVHYSMGSLGRALTLASTNLEDTAMDVKAVWNLCVSGDWQDIIAAIDERTKYADFEGTDRFFTYLLYLIRNSFLQKTGCSETYIDVSDILTDPNTVFANPAKTEKLIHSCSEAISSVKAHGNIALIFVHFVMTIMEILHGEKQQAS